MKIIDYEKKGNQVRFCLGDDNCNDYWGDDWNDVPYEHNAGEVYEEFIRGHIDYVFDFKSNVFEPADCDNSSLWSKEDMKDRKVPCIVIGSAYIRDFYSAICDSNSKRFYFGDSVDIAKAVIYKQKEGGEE